MAYIGNIPAEKYQTLQKQSFTTSATDTYTLSYSVTNPQDLALFINNVRQNPNDAYTVSGTTLTLSSAITSSDTMYAVFLGRAVETIAPATGSVTNNMLAGSIATSKLADGSTFATTNGITMADQWRLTTTFSGDADITSNLERNDSSGYGSLGTGMTESSGVFTFPTTGIYFITYSVTFDQEASGGADVEISALLKVTTDNSSYSEVCNAVGFLNYNNNATITVTSSYILDVTDTSNVKCKFAVSNQKSGNRTIGNSSQNQTCFTFIRLGDT